MRNEEDTSLAHIIHIIPKSFIFLSQRGNNIMETKLVCLSYVSEFKIG